MVAAVTVNRFRNKAQPREKRLRKIPTPVSLANVALHYLGKYAASEASLRRVLLNRMRRAAMDCPEFAADHEKQIALKAEIEKIIDGHKRSGVINDEAFAETKVGSLRRQGRSRRAIEQKLQVKGLARGLIATALDQHEDDHADAELAAAVKLAKKRRLGIFRAGVTEPDRARKDFAAMARAGFSSAVIRQALSSDLEIYDDL